VSNSRCGIFVPVEVRFKWTNTLPHENAIFWGLWDDGFNWDGLQRFIAGYQPPTKHCARQERDLSAFATNAGYKIIDMVAPHNIFYKRNHDIIQQG